MTRKDVVALDADGMTIAAHTWDHQRAGSCAGGHAGAVLAPAADWHSTDGAYSRRNLLCPPGGFRAQLDAPLESGHTAVSPD